MLTLKPIIHAILKDYRLWPGGLHGVSHWARVLENGLRLAELTGANRQVVQLFAVFHDSRRVNDGLDFGHGSRGAELAAKIRGSVFDLCDEEFKLLYKACAGHTDGLTDADVTIQTCWDADRLDLGRVGIYPDPARLCTDAAKTSDTINWAHRRATYEMMPTFVWREWGIKWEKV